MQRLINPVQQEPNLHPSYTKVCREEQLAAIQTSCKEALLLWAYIDATLGVKCAEYQEAKQTIRPTCS